MHTSHNTTVETTEPKISLDLAYTILDFVLESDRTSFAAFSLVCRDLRDAGQSHLYRKLVVSTKARLVALLDALPTMSLRVRSMPREILLSPKEFHDSWSINCAQVVYILDYLPGVDTLTLKSLVVNISINSETHHGLRSLKTLHLTTLYVSSESQPQFKAFTSADVISFMSLFKGIERLCVSLLLHSGGVVDPHSAIEVPLSLRHLEISDAFLDQSILHYLRRMGAAHSLRTIKINSFGPFGALQDLLADDPSVLESLDINKYSDTRTVRPGTTWEIDSSLLTSLRALKLCISHVDGQEATEIARTREYLISSVAHFAAAPIETMRLDIALAFYAGHEQRTHHAIAAVREFDWARLGKAICEYRRLKDVTLEFNTTGGPAGDSTLIAVLRCMGDISECILLTSSRANKALRLTCHWRYFENSGGSGCYTLSRP